MMIRPRKENRVRINARHGLGKTHQPSDALGIDHLRTFLRAGVKPLPGSGKCPLRRYGRVGVSLLWAALARERSSSGLLPNFVQASTPMRRGLKFGPAV